jgi:glycosyltransferase involved in cell wall biosynthesis
MANSTAVIASDLKGVSQVFNDKCGLKVVPKSISDLKDKLSYLLNNSEIIESFKQEAFYLAKKKYLDKNIKEKWLSVLNNREKDNE